MSKCHSCVHADWNESSLWCEDCNSGDRFLSRSVPITVQQPVYLGHRDEGYDQPYAKPFPRTLRELLEVGAIGDGMKTVDVVASGYEWECPQCGYLGKMNTAPAAGSTVQCWECGEYYKVLNVEHAY